MTVLPAANVLAPPKAGKAPPASKEPVPDTVSVPVPVTVLTLLSKVPSSCKFPILAVLESTVMVAPLTICTLSPPAGATLPTHEPVAFHGPPVGVETIVEEIAILVGYCIKEATFPVDTLAFAVSPWTSIESRKRSLAAHVCAGEKVKVAVLVPAVVNVDE